ncbi:MAG: hypothetical protein RJB39_288 [Candidatus Parcubacteria bacterium]|jgi:type IV pilus assembly protein PilC
MRFSYTAKKNDGNVVTAVFEGNSKSELFKELEKLNLILLNYKELNSKSAVVSEKIGAFFGRIKMMDKISFARNLGNMLDAGLSFTRAIAVLEKQTKNKKLKEVYQSISNDISAGKTFHEALQKYPKVFPQLFVFMVKAGEESGNLSESLKVIGNQLEKTYLLQKKVKGAMIYPAVIISVMIIIGIIMMMTVVPKLTQTFAELKTTLPASTRFVVAFSKLINNHFILFLMLVAAGIFGLVTLMKTKKGKRGFDWLVLRIPVIGRIVIESNTAKTTRTLSSLIGSGVNLIQSVEITRDVMQNSYYKDILDETIKVVEKGKSLGTVIEQNEKLYPVFVTEMISVGEETGKLSSMLQGVAVFYENEVEQKTKDLSTIVEPMLMVFVGAAVGFFAVAMITPMYSVMNNL